MGSGRAAIDDFQTGRWGWGIWNSALAISDIFLVKSIVTGLGKVAVKGGEALLTKTAPEVLYHYTTPTAAASIMQNGMTVVEDVRPLLFATNTAELTPIQAQIDLALSANRGLPTSLIQIDYTALRNAGISPVLGPQLVSGGMFGAGGGIEYIFNQTIPIEFLTQIR